MTSEASKTEETVYVIDDDQSARESLRWLLKSANLYSRVFSSADEFLEHYDEEWCGCILMDVRMPGMSGLKLQEILNTKHSLLPIIILTGHANVTMAVTAMKNGAIDFIKKPYRDDVLVKAVHHALELFRSQREDLESRSAAHGLVQNLTAREREVMELVVKGYPNKKIAAELGISEKTVEIHRSRVMQKTNSESVSELVRISILIGM